MFFLREWEVIWKNSRRDWNEQIEDLQFIQNWIQHTKVLTGVPTAGARELRQNWAGSNGKKSANLSQSWKLTQESKGLAHAGYAAKNLPRSHASQVPSLGCPWIGSANPIQDYRLFVVSTCFNPLKIIIYSSRFISSIEMEIQIPKAIPKIYHLQPAATFFLRIANPGCPQVRGPKPLVIGAVLGGKRCHATGCPKTIQGCIK